ncbi:Anaphase-promoting complex subunit 5 [Dermatophagoides pteronyssinus]|uniref:Anaphase-promoting complex subunit 5 n=1 Tax=Dermatophagoides pteronyssinus TaxID=6956 RepID=A0ABQ8J0Z4_DERPT|nr:Anaphase-promoting complex subunit 5 [Dermatophagoides pteronyssinus]
MDFSQFILNESYTLSPYKICVANFICSYLEYRQSHEMSPIESSKSSSSSTLDVNAHGYLSYKLIMSMDCSFEELLFRIENNDCYRSKIAGEVLQIFHKELNRLRRSDIKYFYDFFDKVRLLAQKKFFKNRIKLLDELCDQDHSAAGGFSHNQIHKMSLIGIFLRKLMIYYERLSYCETSTLFDQLQNYLLVTDDNNNGQNDESEKQHCDQKQSNKSDHQNSKLLNNLIHIESKLKTNKAKHNEIFVKHLLELIEKVRSKPIDSTATNNDNNDNVNEQQSLQKTEYTLSSKRKLSDENSGNTFKSLDISMDIDDSMMTPSSNKRSIVISNQQQQQSSIPMDLDITLNDDMDTDMSSIDRTVFDSTNGQKSSLISNSNTTIADDDNDDDGKMKKVSKKINHHNVYDTFEHYIVKQIYKIQYNEKLALTPQQVMQYLREKFTKDNMFYYNRFITYNYLANLNLIRGFEGQTGQTDQPSLLNGNSMLQALDNNRSNNNNMNGTNFNGGIMVATPGGGGGNATGLYVPPIATTSAPITVDSLNKKYRSLFRSINFFNDIEYLKFINALRVNNFTMARKAFFDYFDLKKPSFEPDPKYITNSLTNPSNTSIRNGSIGNGVHHPNGANIPRGMIDGPSNHPGGHQHGNLGFRNQRNGNDSGNNAIDSVSGRNLMYSSSNYCWSSLNLAMMYYHFKYYRLAYDALVDCLSLAREKCDERCLQYTMLWILQISQHLDHSKPIAIEHLNLCSESETNHYLRKKKMNKVYADLDLMENIIGLILTNPLTLPYILAKTFLHFQRLQYLKPGPLLSEQLSLSDVQLDGPMICSNNHQRSPFLPQSIYLAIKYRLFDVLGEQFSMISAIFNAYGGTHLASTYAKLWLRMDVIETIMEERIFRLDESTPIAIRNMAHYLWFVRGDFQQAIDLINCFRKHFSSYNQYAKKIMEQALIEIMFDYNLNIGHWNAATKCLNAIRRLDRTRSYLMLVRLRYRQNEPITALECLDMIIPYVPGGGGTFKQTQMTSESQTFKLSGTTYLRQNLFQSSVSNSAAVVDDYQQEEDHVILKTTNKKPTNDQTSQQQIDSNNSKPISMGSFYSKNLNYYERIQPPPPEELESENERKLVPELDPYTTIECHLIRGTILQDLSILFECVAQSLIHGFKQLECRSLIQIARIQSEQYGQHNDAAEIMESLMHRILSQSTIKDLAESMFVYASILYQINRQQSKEKNRLSSSSSANEYRSIMKRLSVNDGYDNNNHSILDPASKLIKRSIILWQYINDRQRLLDSLRQAALIENDRQNFVGRNFFSKRARQIRQNPFHK